MKATPATIGARLKACMKEGRLSIADLKVWFSRSRTAIVNWMEHGRTPRPEYCEEVLRRLNLLEMLIRKKKGPLVPYKIGALGRPDYIRRLYDDNNNTKISQGDLTE